MGLVRSGWRRPLGELKRADVRPRSATIFGAVFQRATLEPQHRRPFMLTKMLPRPCAA